MTIKKPLIDQDTQTLIPTEFQECKSFWQYCQTVLKLGNTIIKHTNEGRRESWYGRSLKDIGLTPGVCDYQYVVGNKKYHSLWIEMKRKNERNRKKNPDQDSFIEMLMRNGHYATYAYGCDEAITILKDYVTNRI